MSEHNILFETLTKAREGVNPTINKMEDFDAGKARQLVNEIKTEELHNVLIDIRNKAQQSETVLHVYKNLHQQTLDALHLRGFKVVSQPSIAIQRDNLYYSIHW